MAEERPISGLEWLGNFLVLGVIMYVIWMFCGDGITHILKWRQEVHKESRK